MLQQGELRVVGCEKEDPTRVHLDSKEGWVEWKYLCIEGAIKIAYLFSTSPIVSVSVGCCILNSSMISPTTLTKRSRSSTNCSRSPWPRNTSWLMTVSRSPGAKVSFSTTRNPYICMPSDAAAFCRSYKTMCWYRLAIHWEGSLLVAGHSPR